MKEINEYKPGMSEYELFYFLYEKVISRQITTFSKLKEYAAPVFRDKSMQPVIMSVFEVIKRYNWGYFATVNPETHKKLWQEVVIPDKDFPAVGDIKKTLQISDLYVAMLDIHGYTKFCMESRKNLSMMHTLDWAIENEIRRISTQCGVISQRERGDEIVVVAASATDVLMITLCIIDYFEKTNVVNNPEIPTRRTGIAETLPVFRVSAGITGGNTQSPLIITERGNLAGFLLNSGARLQNRANELSPTESKVKVAKQVMMNFQKENANNKCILMENDSIYFLDTGHIEFKGVLIPTCEVIFNKKERYKEKLNDELIKLFNSIRENRWEQRIYIDLMELLINKVTSMPKFSITIDIPVQNLKVITNELYQNLCRLSIKTYCVDDDYHFAVELLQQLILLSEQIRTFDRLVLDYMKGIYEKYSILLGYYESHIDHEVNEKAINIFHGKHYKTWLAAKNGSIIFKKMRAFGRKSKDITKRKTLWHKMILRHKDQMEFTLYSGKK
jgi:hypothetical protein